MNDTPRKSTVTLEDLLRVKRAESPPAEFWTEFERGLRTKQLAAIVEPRPWWAPLIRMGARASRYQLPVGAAAILAITFVSLREYRVSNVTPASEPAAIAAASLTPVAAEPANNLSSDTVSAPVSTSVPMMISETPVPTVEMAEEKSERPVVATTTATGVSSHLMPVAVQLTPSAAENLAAARADDPQLDRVLNRLVRTDDSTVVRVEPLAQVSVPGESRRARLLGGNAWFASASSGGDSTLRTDDQSSRRLTERRLSESEISRINVDGSRLTVRF